MMTALPSGPLGRALALSVTLVLVLLLTVGVILPLREFYLDQNEQLAQRGALANRMARLAAELPDLTRQADLLSANGPAQTSLLAGESDAIAGARLQEVVQALALRDAITLTSAETLPAVAVGHYRRIGLRIAFIAPYPVLARLLQAIATASPRMLIDDLQIDSPHLINQPIDQPLQTELTVLAFRAANNGGGPLAAAK